MKVRRSIIIECIYVLICVLTAFFIMPKLCCNLPYSYFYQPPNHSQLYNKINHANSVRTRFAKEYLSKNNFSYLFEHQKRSNIKFCFVIITTQRHRNPHYLTQSTVRLLQQLKHFTNYTFTIYNVGGRHHIEALNLSVHVPVISDFNNTFVSNSYNSEGHDYVSALKWCHRKKPMYSIIIEDDALADQNFAAKLNFVLNYCIHEKTNSKWAFLKLFYPEKYQGWGNHSSCIAELIVSIVVLGNLVAILSCICLPGPLLIGTAPFKLTIKGTFYWRLGLSMCLVSFLILMFGRAHWEELRKLSTYFVSVVTARGCCTPAVLYPHAHLGALIKYLDSIYSSSKLPIDLALDDFVEKNSLQKLLVVPNLFSHIGLISSLPKGMKNLHEFNLLLQP